MKWSLFGLYASIKFIKLLKMVKIITSTLKHLAILGIWPTDETQFVYKHYLCKYIIILLLSSFLLWGGILHSIMQESSKTNFISKIKI